MNSASRRGARTDGEQKPRSRDDVTRGDVACGHGKLDSPSASRIVLRLTSAAVCYSTRKQANKLRRIYFISFVRRLFG